MKFVFGFEILIIWQWCSPCAASALNGTSVHATGCFIGTGKARKSAMFSKDSHDSQTLKKIEFGHSFCHITRSLNYGTYLVLVPGRVLWVDGAGREAPVAHLEDQAVLGPHSGGEAGGPVHHEVKNRHTLLVRQHAKQHHRLAWLVRFC